MNLDDKIFLAINRLSGRNRFGDMFARAGAEFVIVGMAGWFAVGLFLAFLPNYQIIFLGAILFGAIWALGFLLSLLIGFIAKHTRPVTHHPEIRLLFHPLSNWKSFPSDHAFAAFLFFFLALIFGLPGAWGLLPLALWVGWGRIYAGVHYPFDIVGGATLAGLMAVLAYYLLVVVGLSF